MRPILQRVLFPAATLILGVVAIVYGMRYHTHPVWRKEIEEREVEEEVVKTTKIAVPIGLLGGRSGRDGRPTPPDDDVPAAETPPPADDADAPPPGMKFVTQKMTVTETVKRPVPVDKLADEPESWLNFAATIGGVQRREGALWRTYGPDESPPSLCPT